MKLLDFSCGGNFTYVNLHGKTSKEEVVGILEEIKNRMKDVPEIKVLSDCREADLSNVKMETLTMLSEYFNTRFQNIFTRIRWANLTQYPFQTACSVIFADLVEKDSTNFNQFTTPAAALSWLGMSLQCIDRLDSKQILLSERRERLSQIIRL